MFIGGEQADRDEVHGAVAQSTEMSGVEMRTLMGGLENQAKQTWISHHLLLLIEMSSFLGGVLFLCNGVCGIGAGVSSDTPSWKNG